MLNWAYIGQTFMPPPSTESLQNDPQSYSVKLAGIHEDHERVQMDTKQCNILVTSQWHISMNQWIQFIPCEHMHYTIMATTTSLYNTMLTPHPNLNTNPKQLESQPLRLCHMITVLQSPISNIMSLGKALCWQRPWWAFINLMIDLLTLMDISSKN